MAILLIESFLCPFPILVPDKEITDDNDNDETIYSSSPTSFQASLFDSSPPSMSSPSTSEPLASSPDISTLTGEPPRATTPPTVGVPLSALFTTPLKEFTSTHNPVNESRAASGSHLAFKVDHTRIMEDHFLQQDMLSMQHIPSNAFLSIILGLRFEDTDQRAATTDYIAHIAKGEGWTRHLKEFSDAWGKPGGETNVYAPLVALINWVVKEISDRHSQDSSCFPGIQRPALIRADDTHSHPFRGSPTNRKPDIAIVDVALHPQSKRMAGSEENSNEQADNKNANKRTADEYHHYQKTMCFIEVKKKDAHYADLKIVPTAYGPAGSFSNATTSATGGKRGRNSEEGAYEIATKKMRVSAKRGDDDNYNPDDKDDDDCSSDSGSEIDDEFLSPSHERADKEGDHSDSWFEDEVSSDYGDPVRVQGKASKAESADSDTQLFSYMLELFDNGALRDHVISAVVAKDGFEFIYCDRSVIVRTGVIKGFNAFILFIYGLLRLDRRGWGYMQPLAIAKDPINLKMVKKITTLGQVIPKQFLGRHLYHPRTEKPLFKMGSVLFSSRSLKGRGTKVVTVVPDRAQLTVQVHRQIARWRRGQKAIEEGWIARVDSAEKDREIRLLQAKEAHRKALEEQKARKPEADSGEVKDILAALTDEDSDTTSTISQPSSSEAVQLSAQSSYPASTGKQLKRTHAMDFTTTRRIGKVVAKISSPPAARETEFKMVRYLTKAGANYKYHLPYFYAHYNFKFAKDTPQARMHRWKGIKYEMRHLRIILQDLRYPITQIYSLKDMAAAYADISKVLIWLDSQGIHHRDVSLSNCQFRLVNPEQRKDGRLTLGVLSDFDLSVFKSVKRPSANFRTGTKPYMAIEILWAIKKPGRHFLRYDFESLFYVIIFHINAYYLDGGPKRNHGLSEWFLLGYKQLASFKTGFLKYKLNCQPQYNALIPSLTEMRVKFAQIVDQVLTNKLPGDILENAGGHFIVQEFEKLFEEFAKAAGV